jgi:hypothetical protein
MIFVCLTTDRIGAKTIYVTIDGFCSLNVRYQSEFGSAKTVYVTIDGFYHCA